MAAQLTNGAKPSSVNGFRRRSPVTVLSPVAEVHETPTDVVVRVRLERGAIELSVPKHALRDPRPARRPGTPGSTPDATPC